MTIEMKIWLDKGFVIDRDIDPAILRMRHGDKMSRLRKYLDEHYQWKRAIFLHTDIYKGITRTNRSLLEK